MANNTNLSTQFASDFGKYINKKVLPLSVRQLVAYQFGTKRKLDKGNGVTYQATRFVRVPLPQYPISEGIAPPGETMSIQIVTGVAQQWGDRINLTDVSELTTFHPVWKQAERLLALQVAETLERNTFNALMAGSQVNYVGAVAGRGALTSSNVLSPHEIDRAVGVLTTVGAPRFMGDKDEDTKVQMDGEGPARASKPPLQNPHYVAIMHPLPTQDMRENSVISNAWSYSDINRLYNMEVGEWGGVRFTVSNMVPPFIGVAAVSPTAGTAGNLATGTYYVIVTGTDTQKGYESYICQVSAGVSVTGPTGSISVPLPTNPGYTYNVYIGTTTSPTNLGLCASGPTYGPAAGQAVGLVNSTTAVITGVGMSQTPPAAPATGVTVYPTFIFGRDAYSQVELDKIDTFYLREADKFDPLNQLRMLSWKIFYGTLIENQEFMLLIEGASAFVSTPDAGGVDNY